jgi:3',5'-cyclic AMP phosphodiesterase CpdA
MKILLVADTHLAPHARQFRENWEAIRHWIDTIQPELLVHLGDITAHGVDDPTQIAAVASFFDDLPCKIMFLPGNHDIGDNPKAPGLPGEQALEPRSLREYRRVFGPDRWSLDLDGWQVIGLNAQLLGTESREEEEQFSWLSAELSRRNGALGLLLHKPLFRSGPGDDEVHVRYVPAIPRRRLIAALEARDLRFVASGHAHQARQFVVNGVEHVWVPSASFFIPDEVQERIGEKKVGVVTLELAPSRHRFDAHYPLGLKQHNLLDHPDVYPEVAAWGARTSHGGA